MTRLAVYPDHGRDGPEILRDFDAIAGTLREFGVELEQWDTDRPLDPQAGQIEVLEAYDAQIRRLNARYGLRSMDVVSLRPDDPKKAEMRRKFLNEHTHEDFELRYFVDGSGIFYLHTGDRVYAVLCTAGNLMSLPAGMAHWFDMGENPDFKCIRFFTAADGWVGHFTGSDISSRFPDFDTLAARLR